ncbi:MAG TPA: histidine kinase [Anaerolineales bacterium]|nr:histidine kinase [Anaerolineales bacterium]
MTKTNRRYLPKWRGFTTQLVVLTILPLTLLLLTIAFGSVYMHQQDMRALVGERDSRAVQSAAAAVGAELHHRGTTIASLALFIESETDLSSGSLLITDEDLMIDFDGGLAYFDGEGNLLATTHQNGPWNWFEQNRQTPILATSTDTEPVFSVSIRDPNSNRIFIVISVYSPYGTILAGAFSPEALAGETLAPSYPEDSHATIYLLDSSGDLLFVSGAHPSENTSLDLATTSNVLSGENGTTYITRVGAEHVLAYSPIPITGWVLLSDEAWETVGTPSLQVTQVAPLVLVPAFLLALIALWFSARRIIQPLQKLESKAAALAWGDFEGIKESVGGISEINQLQNELEEMAHKVKSAQVGLRDYIGAITSAQEEERHRLARELHDDTIQAVIALKQRVQLIKKAVKDKKTHQSLDELETLSEQTIENLRRLTRALRPIYLEDLGLVTALEMLARETSDNNSLSVNFQKNGQERRLAGEVELVLYRIAQEALNNVIRHADASNATLYISYKDKEVQLDVIDDGVGFQIPNSPTDFAPSGHFGLMGIHERAELIGARLKIESALGEGARLKVRL